MKRLLSLLLLFACTSGISSTDYCAFCDPAVLKNQTFYEDDLVLALYTHKPVLPGHCLVIPKRHVSCFDGLTDSESAQICVVLKKVDKAVREVFATGPYLLLQKNGREVGQSVPHVHFHYIPRKCGEYSALSFFYKLYTADLHKPMKQSEMDAIMAKLRTAIKQ